MITRFKMFENDYMFSSRWQLNKYEVGAWVLLAEPETWKVYPYVKIIDKNSAKTHYNKYNEDDYEMPQDDYQIVTYSLNNDEVKTFWVDDSEIERELTPDEIEEVKIKLDTNKYNL